MKNIFVIFVLLVGFVAAVSTPKKIIAKRPNLFETTIHWGQLSVGGDRWTETSFSSDPADNIFGIFTLGPLGPGPRLGLSRDIEATPDGNTFYWTPNVARVQLADGNIWNDFLTSEWNSSNCLNGPRLTVSEQSSVQVEVENYGDENLFVSWDDGAHWIGLSSGQARQHAFGKDGSGQVYLSTAESNDMNWLCSSLEFDFSRYGL